MENIAFFEQDVRVSFMKRLVARKCLLRVLGRLGCVCGGVNYIFCSDAYLLKINREYLNHDTFTDIITFDYSLPSGDFGEEGSGFPVEMGNFGGSDGFAGVECFVGSEVGPGCSAGQEFSSGSGGSSGSDRFSDPGSFSGLGGFVGMEAGSRRSSMPGGTSGRGGFVGAGVRSGCSSGSGGFSDLEGYVGLEVGSGCSFRQDSFSELGESSDGYGFVGLDDSVGSGSGTKCPIEQGVFGGLQCAAGKGGRLVSGDIYISIDRVKENAKKFHVKQIDELNRVMIHGLLHLAGFKDKLPEEEKMMHAKEDEMLAYCFPGYDHLKAKAEE